MAMMFLDKFIFASSCFSVSISAINSLSWILYLKYTYNSLYFALNKSLVLFFGMISSRSCTGIYCSCIAAYWRLPI